MSRVRRWVAGGVTLAGLALVAGCGEGDGDAVAAGGAVESAGDCRTDTSPNGTDEPEGEPPNTVEELTDLVPVPDLPPPTIPENVAPPTTPTTQPGDEPLDPDPVDILDPDGESIPAIGGFRVDPPAFGCTDFAVHIDEYQRFRIRTWGDSGIYTEVQVFSPSGQQIAHWETGAPESYEGYAWDESGVAEPGTHVIRTIHRGGSHNAFVVVFYGDNPVGSETPETSVTTAPT